MTTLSAALRKQLETAVLAARRASESASRAAIDGLGVSLRDRPEYLDAYQASMRNGLRAKQRQLGGERELLIAECAYEQWHRLLFARFLAENDLLLHPQYRTSVTLADCEDLAAELGEPDGWSVAARFAAEILPGIFQLDDPCVRLRLAPEGRHSLEQILIGLPSETFTADDALGWVYQFWQKDKKDEVNASERKIGGADLGPVTQLFTENYMVRFLLENSLGAWWAARHPDSPLLKGFDYLRFGDDGKPAAGSFEGWPERVAEVTVMDPCCGSGHFLVEAFSMLWRMRAEEEGRSAVDAQDAVLRDNLFGLELDPRCVQIAMFAVALQAWKAGGGWRRLPVPNIACSGIPVKAPVEEWKALAGGDERLQRALVRLHVLFRDADTLGSLIDPRRVVEDPSSTGIQRSFEDVDWATVAPLVEKAVGMERGDPAAAVLGADATGNANAARVLGKRATLVATNVPYLKRAKHGRTLTAYGDGDPTAQHDLANLLISRQLGTNTSDTLAVVSPQNWLVNVRHSPFRRRMLENCSMVLVAVLGEHAFASTAAAGAFVQLAIVRNSQRQPGTIAGMDCSEGRSPAEKAELLRRLEVIRTSQADLLADDQARIVFHARGSTARLRAVARAWQGIATSDYPRFGRFFWELAAIAPGWVLQQSTVVTSRAYGGRERVLFWEDGHGAITEVSQAGATFRGQEAWDARGVAVSQMRSLPVSLYTGEKFDNNTAVITPSVNDLLPAIWSFCRSSEFHDAVRAIDKGVKVTNSTLTKVPFDIEYWRKVAAESYPNGLPEPWSDDPTQWLFEGRPEMSTAPLQVAVGRLVGFRWPEQAVSDDLDGLADADGIVCLPSVAGEAPAAERVQQVLGTAFGAAWSPAKAKELLAQTGSKKSLADWLRDEFFKQHCAVFGNRPFVWHISDGQRDGFSALVNYHRLDRRMLQKLTYTYLGQDWMERQRAEVRDDVPGAEARLSAALGLQRKLEAILDGEKPYDIYVRWKQLHEQPVGWEPHLNDGVRLNIRPFVKADVLRALVNIRWDKDRGKNPDGSDRHNDLHLTLAAKLDARKRAGVA